MKNDIRFQMILSSSIIICIVILFWVYILITSYGVQSEEAVVENSERRTYLESTNFILSGPNSEYPFPTQHTLPVLSIKMEPDDLWSEETGIYVRGLYKNYNQHGIEWERPAEIFYYDKDGNLGFKVGAGVRIYGGATRSTAQKSLRIITRRDYGERSIVYPIFDDHPYYVFDQIVLRNAGNDWRSTMLRDPISQKVYESVLDTQAYSPCVVYLNDEYWGIHNIREVYDERYFHERYAADKNDVVIIEPDRDDNGYPEINVGKEGDEISYVEMVDYIEKNDMATDQNLEYVSTLMDLENYCDYIIVGSYLDKTDWFGKNFAIWRNRTDEYVPDAAYGLDGRWRWLQYDMDSGFAAKRTLSVPEDHDTLKKWFHTDLKYGPWTTSIFLNLIKNESFKNDLLNRYADLINTTFQSENVLPIIDEYENAIRDEIPGHIDRWKGELDKSHKPPFQSLDEWESNVQMLREFAAKRPDYDRANVVKDFDLAGTCEIALNLSPYGSGQVRINSALYSEENQSPVYFQEIPVAIEAIPADGQIFVGWDGDSELLESDSRETKLICESDAIELTAIFSEKDK
ncbi:hypothetical protein GF357_03520 [Candidatus Dojkabacteria bacterium]|nr:hypothetical protein [Candidatus Dojkabacteria bacterium]